MKRDLAERWDAAFAAHAALRARLLKTGAVQPLLHVAKVVPSTLKGLDEQDVVYALRAEHINALTLLVEGFDQGPLSTLSPRMRQPLHPGDVLICTTGQGNQVAFLGEAMGLDDAPILGSATVRAVGENGQSAIFEVREDAKGQYYHLVTLWKATAQEEKLYERYTY